MNSNREIGGSECFAAFHSYRSLCVLSKCCITLVRVLGHAVGCAPGCLTNCFEISLISGRTSVWFATSITGTCRAQHPVC